MTLEELKKKWNHPGDPMYGYESDRNELIQDCISAGFTGCIYLDQNPMLIITLREFSRDELIHAIQYHYYYDIV